MKQVGATFRQMYGKEMDVQIIHPMLKSKQA
jgi:hypothetical protein